MSYKSVARSDVARRVRVENHSPPLKALAVGDKAEWALEGHVMPQAGMAFVAFLDIDEDTLAALSPSVVYSPLLAKTFDCIELALLLSKIGFSGQYRALARDLPKPAVIEREVRQLCPALDFRIIEGF